VIGAGAVDPTAALAREVVVAVPVRTGEPGDTAFIVEMARFASAIADRPLPPADDPELARGLPRSPDTAVLAVDHDGHPVGAAWWHFRDSPLVVTPDGEPVPELVIAVMPADRGHGVGRCLLDALTARAAEHGYDRLSLNVHIGQPRRPALQPRGIRGGGKGTRAARRRHGSAAPDTQVVTAARRSRQHPAS